MFQIIIWRNLQLTKLSVNYYFSNDRFSINLFSQIKNIIQIYKKFIWNKFRFDRNRNNSNRQWKPALLRSVSPSDPWAVIVRARSIVGRTHSRLDRRRSRFLRCVVPLCVYLRRSNRRFQVLFDYDWAVKSRLSETMGRVIAREKWKLSSVSPSWGIRGWVCHQLIKKGEGW